ncbi:MAG: hypothetical protein WCN95_06275 [bacterium]
MLAAEYIRKNRKIPDKSIDNYLFAGPFDYPPLLPVFLAMFSKSVRLVLQAILSPLIEVCHGVLVFVLVLYLAGSTTAAVISQLLFMLVPITVLENSQLTARSPGSLLLTISLVGVTAFTSTGDWLWFGIALTAAVLIHFTHKMASQALLLFSLLAIPLLPWIWGVVLIGPLSLLVTLLLARKTARRILTGHVAVLRYYWRIFMTLRSATGSVESPSLVGRLVKLAKSNPLIAAIGANPWIVLVIPAAVASRQAATALSMIELFWLVAVYTLIVATTWVRPLRFLGDGPRYSYYLSFPIAFAGGPLIAACIDVGGCQAGVITAVLILAGTGIAAGIIFLQFKAVMADKERSFRGDVKAIVEILKRANPSRVLVLPLCTAEIVAFFADCSVLSTDSALVHAEDPDFRNFNPRREKPVSFFLERYDITHVMAENTPAFMSSLNLPGEFTRKYDGADFVLWSRNPAGNAT